MKKITVYIVPDEQKTKDIPMCDVVSVEHANKLNFLKDRLGNEWLCKDSILKSIVNESGLVKISLSFAVNPLYVKSGRYLKAGAGELVVGIGRDEEAISVKKAFFSDVEKHLKDKFNQRDMV